MDSPSYEIKITARWWLKYYVIGVIYFSELTGQKISQEKFTFWCRKGLKTEVFIDGINRKKLPKIKNMKKR